METIAGKVGTNDAGNNGKRAYRILMLQLFLEDWPDEVWFHGLSALAGAIPSYLAQYAIKWPYFKDNLKHLTDYLALLRGWLETNSK